MDSEKLHKFVLNQLHKDSEIEEVVDWIEASEANKEEFETLKNLWAISGFDNYDSYVESNQRRISTFDRKQVGFMNLLRYAAIFVLAFFIGSLSVYFLGMQRESVPAQNEIIVPDGESAEVYLSDNTHIWLNSGTKLVYPAKFKGGIRKVQLNGEAYFDVTHNPKNPFQVKTPRLTVEVMGTSFNVEAFDKTGEVNVTLVNGKVNLQNTDGKVLTELFPGENALFDLANKKMSIAKVNTDFYTSWKNGYLLFENETLEEIAAKFERWYNVKVIFDDEEIKQIKYTGSILKNKPIDQVFDILKYTAGIEYSIEIINNKPSIIHLKCKST